MLDGWCAARGYPDRDTISYIP